MSTTPATDDYVANNDTYAASFTDGDLAGPPARSIAVVTCMDARIDVTAALGLDNGDAHVLRNAGGIVTDWQGNPAHEGGRALAAANAQGQATIASVTKWAGFIAIAMEVIVQNRHAAWRRNF